jgi:hypothetical protein
MPVPASPGPAAAFSRQQQQQQVEGGCKKIDLVLLQFQPGWILEYVYVTGT